MRGRTTQRTDSTYVLAWVRDLTRLELITEAVRAPCGLPGRASESLRSYRIVLVRHGPCTRAEGWISRRKRARNSGSSACAGWITGRLVQR